MTPPHRVGKYDVFISHCGKDCSKGFTDLLRNDLERAGVQCFFDEHSLEVDDTAPAEMLKAMKEATYGVVILSPGFWEREWCMKELETFVRRERIVPVFYGGFQAVSAAAKAAMAKRVWRGFQQSKWDEEAYLRLAQESVSFTGVRLEEESWWLSCIRRVRDEVLRLLGKVGGGIRISEDELLVGQEEHLRELKRLLGLPQEGVPGTSETRAAGEVGIVGVKGMGGVGKTTMAKKLYDQPDVREWFTGGICWLVVGPNPNDDKIQDLQKQILKQLGNVDEDPGNPDRGRELIRQRLSGKRVLIYLDDVWETVSVETSVVNVSDLAPGSRILKTSRKKESIGGHIHDLDALGPEPAWELFGWHAFGGQKPPEDLAQLAKEAAERCGGLPLALRVLGRQVAEAEDTTECITGFLELPRFNNAMRACRSVIKTSYDNLPTDFPGLGNIFVLVAKVWPRTPKFMQHQRAVKNLGAAVYGAEPRNTRFKLARKALDKLDSLSLVGLKEDGDVGELCLTVHDLIVDVAESLGDGTEQGGEKFFRQPADAEGLGLPQSFSRLEHISIHSGSLSIRKVSAACSLVLGPDAKLVGSLPDDDEPSPCKLLDMEGFRSVPLNELANLRCLRLRRGSFDLFPEGIENLRYLCILEPTDCNALTSLPESVGALTGLTSLDLFSCEALTSLPESVRQLTGLTSLDLIGCKALQSVPESVGALTGLRSLDLRWCEALTSLPESVGKLTGLRSLGLSGCETLQSVPESVGALTGLRSLDLRWCEALTSLPESVGKLTGLRSLGLSGCETLQSVLESVGALTGLTSLGLSRCKALTSLPESVGRLTGLESLDLSGCGALQSLPEWVGQLTDLQLDGCEALRSLPESVRALMEQGDDRTQCSLGWCYQNGRGVEKDEACAAELYAKAAERGNAEAQSRLGDCYARGRGVEKDGAEAVTWMRRGAERGDLALEANLAELLMEGLGGPPDWVEALQLFESSLGSYAPSKITSAWMLWGGQHGVQQDRLKAKAMCEEVLTTEDLEDQVRDWEALRWTWPAALKWFRSEAWRTDELSGEAVERGEGESEAEARTERLKKRRRMD
jgi:Leucine-rich repeat (LRR) protein